MFKDNSSGNTSKPEDSTVDVPTGSIVASGVCGENNKLNWSLSENGTLTISGNGKFSSDEYFYPWDDYVQQISNIVIKEGVTELQDGMFFLCERLTRVTIPASVATIGFGVFSMCNSLTSITVDKNNAKYYSQNNCIIEIVFKINKIN